MNFAPQFRILVRYAVGGFLGYSAAKHAALSPLADPAITEAISAIAVSALTEAWYAKAKKDGGST